MLAIATLHVVTKHNGKRRGTHNRNNEKQWNPLLWVVRKKKRRTGHPFINWIRCHSEIHQNVCHPAGLRIIFGHNKREQKTRNDTYTRNATINDTHTNKRASLDIEKGSSEIHLTFEDLKKLGDSVVTHYSYKYAKRVRKHQFT